MMQGHTTDAKILQNGITADFQHEVKRCEDKRYDKKSNNYPSCGSLRQLICDRFGVSKSCHQ
jgi:hypothetical protein